MSYSDSAAVQPNSEMQAICQRMALKYNVTPALHDDDLLLRYYIEKLGPNAVEAYFHGGNREAIKVKSLVERLFPGSKDLSILEFASGYGRVTRHLRNQLLQHRLVAADIHPAACRFISQSMGVRTHCSSTDPARLNVGNDYDLIVVLSLFSHLPPWTFGRWLLALYERLRVGGYLMVTVHGPASMERTQIHAKGYSPRRGFGYRGLSDQSDLDPRDYGTMVVSLPYFSRTVANAIPTARIVSFASGAWFGSQDEWVIQRKLIDPTAARFKWTLSRRLGRLALRIAKPRSAA